MSYLKGMQDMVITLEANDLNMTWWFFDDSHAVHPNCKGHTGAGLTLGKASVFSKSTKQKIS